MTKRRYEVDFSWPSESFLCSYSINNNHLEYLQVEGQREGRQEALFPRLVILPTERQK